MIGRNAAASTEAQSVVAAKAIAKPAKPVKKHPKPMRPQGAAKVIAETASVTDDARIVEHPGGYYWIDAETGAPAEGESPPHLEEP